MTTKTMSIVTGNWMIAATAFSVSVFSNLEPMLRVILLIGSITLTAVQLGMSFKEKARRRRMAAAEVPEPPGK